jgi:hypothetical protein
MLAISAPMLSTSPRFELARVTPYNPAVLTSYRVAPGRQRSRTGFTLILEKQAA